MLALLRCEFVKARTTRALSGLVAGAIAVALLGAISVITSGDARALARPLNDQQYFLLASINISLFGLVLGIREFTDEYRNGTIVPTVLATPKRERVFVAKAFCAAVLGLILAAIAATVMVLLSVPLLSLKGVALEFGADEVGAVTGLAVSAALWAALDVGLGAAVRQQVAAIVAGLIWVLVVENLAASFLGTAGRFLPGQAGHALASASQAQDPLPLPLAAVVLLGYVAVSSVVGAALFGRRDMAAS
jgi:ABC-2 type transport system permease protein